MFNREKCCPTVSFRALFICENRVKNEMLQDLEYEVY